MNKYQISRVRVAASIKWSSRVKLSRLKNGRVRVYSTKYQYFQCRIPCDYWNSQVRVGSSRLKNSRVEPNMRISKYSVIHYLKLFFICLEWSRWSGCNKKCGKGQILRSRTCTNPKAENGGSDCNGDSVQQRSCYLKKCPNFTLDPMYLIPTAQKLIQNQNSKDHLLKLSQVCTYHCVQK